MYGAYAPVLNLFLAEYVSDPVHIAAVVHVAVHVQVAVVSFFLADYHGVDLWVQNVHHLGQSVFAGEQGNGKGTVGGILGLAGLQVHQEP